MSNDPLSNYINESFKQIADAWNDSLEQAKRQRECKMRRFHYVWDDKVTEWGVAFPNGNVIVQYIESKTIHIYNSIADFEEVHCGAFIQWIDPEASK